MERPYPVNRFAGARDSRPGYVCGGATSALPEILEDEADEVMIYSPEIGERVTTTEAVRERVRLHPRARTQEILAMFELDGTRVSPALVQRIKREELGDLA